METYPIEKFLLFDKIKPYDYSSVANKLEKYYKTTNVDIFNKLVNLSKTIEKNKIIFDPNENISLLLSYYVQCRPDVKISISTNIINNRFLYSITHQKRKIYAVKPIRLLYREAISFFYQIYFLRNNFKSFGDLQTFVNNLYLRKSDMYFVIVIYEGVDIDIKNSYSFNSETFQETIELTKFVFNKNSMENLNNIFVRNYFNPKFQGCFDYLKFFKKYIIENVLPIDRERIMIYSSAILFVFGIRPCQDLDVYINWLPLKGQNKDFANKLIKLVNANNKFSFIDMAFKEQGEWVKGGKKEYLDEWFLIDWPNLFGAKDMQEVVFNPIFNFQFMGLKFLSLNGDIARRKCRSRPASYADLIAINYYLKMNVDIPQLPLEYYKVPGSGKKEKLDTLKKMIQFYKTIQFKLLDRFGLKFNVDKIISFVPPNSELKHLLK